MEFDVVEREKHADVADVASPGGVALQDSKYTVDSNHCRCYLHHSSPPCNYQKSESWGKN